MLVPLSVRGRHPTILGEGTAVEKFLLMLGEIGGRNSINADEVRDGLLA